MIQMARLAILLAGIGLLGCDTATGTSRYQLSGTVTYQGKPVPYGLIYFDPDSTQGNSGVQGSGEIIDGVYQTSAAQGIQGGPTRVRIIGFDGKPPAGPEAAMFPHGMDLFPEKIVSIDLPAASGTQDFHLD